MQTFNLLKEILSWIKSHKFLLFSIIINIILCLCLMGNCKRRDPIIDPKYIPVHDTITITQERIIEKTKIKYVNLTDTFYINKNDTVFVQVPIEYKQYSDTINNDSTEAQLQVFYHGAFAELDSVDLKYRYNKEVQTITIPPKKWNMVVSFGPYVGFGIHGNIQQGTFGYGPEIGVGVQVGIGRTIQISK